MDRRIFLKGSAVTAASILASQKNASAEIETSKSEINPSEMIYRPFGKTGKMVSTVGFGAMRFDTSKSDYENAKLVIYAYEKGINWFDTAPTYCNGKSEKILGLAFKELASERDKFFVCTKQSPDKASTIERTQQTVEGSLSRLGLDYVDFFYVWCIRSMDQYRNATRPGGEYDGLKLCKEQGKVKHITVSSHMPGDGVEKILADDYFEGVLIGVNILNFPYRWKGVESAYNKDIGVVAMNPLAGGVIPKNEDKFQFLAEKGETPTEAALRFNISAPQITVTLNGFTTKEHIDMACNVAKRCKELPATKLESIKHNLTGNMNKLCTTCGYCLKGCPVKIPIDEYMNFYNYKLFLKMSDQDMMNALAKEQGTILKKGGGKAGDCLKCGICERECTQHLDIIKRLEDIAVWEKVLKQKTA